MIFKFISGEFCEKIPIEDLNFLIYKVGLNETEHFLDNVKFRLEKPAVLYAFDFLETHESISTKTIVEAYLKRGDHNILVLDYGKYSGGNYFFDAVPYVIKASENSEVRRGFKEKKKINFQIGETFGAALIDLSVQIIDVESFHLIGFSPSAHLMNPIGRIVQELSNNTLKISRITGLDPALPASFPKMHT